MDNKDYILFLDCETEGLDPNKHDIWEIAAKITDSSLYILDEFHVYWKHDDYGGEYTFEQRIKDIEQNEEYVYEMHKASGLLDDWIRAQTEEGMAVSYGQIDNRLCDFTSRFDDEGLIVLAGSSVGFDHRFIDYYLPNLSSKLSYHHLDLSSVKLFMNLIKPNISDKYRNDIGNKHRAMDDITRDVLWAQNYRTALQELLLNL